MSWVGLRGAVPIIFATYPLTAGIENASLIFNIVFFITIVSLVVQGTTVNFMAKKLKLTDDRLPKPEIQLRRTAGGDQIHLSEIDVTADMLVKGDRLMDLPLPDDELVVTVKRDDTFFIPNGRSKALSERQADDHFAQQKNPDTEVPDSNTPSNRHPECRKPNKRT